VRTDLGREIVDRMIRSGAIIARPADSDEKAMKLLRTLSVVSRRRWPAVADPAPMIGVPPPKKKAAAAPAPAAPADPTAPKVALAVDDGGAAPAGGSTAQPASPPAPAD